VAPLIPPLFPSPRPGSWWRTTIKPLQPKGFTTKILCQIYSIILLMKEAITVHVIWHNKIEIEHPSKPSGRAGVTQLKMAMREETGMFWFPVLIKIYLSHIEQVGTAIPAYQKTAQEPLGTRTNGENMWKTGPKSTVNHHVGSFTTHCLVHMSKTRLRHADVLFDLLLGNIGGIWGNVE